MELCVGIAYASGLKKRDVSSIFLVFPLTIGEEIAAPNVVAIAGKLATHIMK